MSPMPGGAPQGLWVLGSLHQGLGSAGGCVDLEDAGGDEAASAGRDRRGTWGLGRYGEPVRQGLCRGHPGRLFWGPAGLDSGRYTTWRPGCVSVLAVHASPCTTATLGV